VEITQIISEGNMEKINIQLFNDSFSNKEYIKGSKKEYYILTVKIDENNYKFMVIKNDVVLYDGYQNGLNHTKYSSLVELNNIDSSALDITKLSMVHYKEDRPNGNPWVKDSNKELQRHINLFLKGNTSTVEIPPLEPTERNREFQLYKDEIKSKVIYEYLFNSMTHRALDEKIIGLDPDESRGYQAMGILHHIGLKEKHKGIFRDTLLGVAISSLKQQDSNFIRVIEFLERIQNQVIEEERLGSTVVDDIEAELSEEDTYYKDGAIKEYYGKRYERNPENRRKAIEFHGLNCAVCGFNFEEFYGAWGKDFIEVHHLNPLSTIQTEVKIDPKKDLAPVCSNCHRMLHRKKDNVLSISELRQKLKYTV